MAFEASTAAVVVPRHVHLGLLVDTDNCKNAIGLYYTASSHIEILGSTSNEYTVSRALRRRYSVAQGSNWTIRMFRSRRTLYIHNCMD